MWKIEHRAYRLPFRAAVRTAHGPWAEREGFLVRAVRILPDGTETGRVGWGEVAPISWFGTETVAEARAALEGLRGGVTEMAEALERVPMECVSVRAALAAAGEELGAGSGEREVESGEGGDSPVKGSAPSPGTAGRGRGPWGGGGVVGARGWGPRHGAWGAGGENPEKGSAPSTGTSRPVSCTSLPLAGLLPAGRAALDAVQARLELGFRTFKWKVGVGAASDEWAILDDLLGELPTGARLRLDANGAWDRKLAEGWLARAAERPMIEYVEQPCFADVAQGTSRVRQMDDLLRGLAEDFPVKIALDESITGASDVEKWLAMGWAGVWVIKPALLGEPEAILEKLARAKADVVFGSALETAVGARAGLRLAFGWAEREARPVAERRALGYGVWPLFQNEAANAPLSGPFVRREDVERINPEALWNALG